VCPRIIGVKGTHSNAVTNDEIANPDVRCAIGSCGFSVISIPQLSILHPSAYASRRQGTAIKPSLPKDIPKLLFVFEGMH
jgi:hypothetical protein